MISTLSPKEISCEFSASSHKKTGINNRQLAVYGILGGAFISLGGALSVMVAGGMPGVAATNPGLVKLLFGAMFPLGLVLVVIAGAELFTSDCAVMPMAKMYGIQPWKQVLRMLFMAYVFNFVGALLVAYILHLTGIFSHDSWQAFLHGLAEKKLHGGFVDIMAKGIVANWLVCLAVWMATAAKDAVSKAVLIWFPVMAFVTMGMEHSIANMFFFPMAIFEQAPVSWGQFLYTNLIPATIGNIIGGAVFVALPYAIVYPKINKPHHASPQDHLVVEKDEARVLQN
ncbi:MAG TPA: formate/nitrite transporter family protein [Phnomibacter sp.]|nr:formate/nitrite transporter family protein [Phnomibacter sp.]